MQGDRPVLDGYRDLARGNIEHNPDISTGSWHPRDMRIVAILGMAYTAVTVYAQVTPLMTKKGLSRRRVIRTPALDTSHQYSLLYSLHRLAGLTPESRLEIEVRQSGTVVLRKTLHAGDPDWYTQFRALKAGPAEISIQPSQYARDNSPYKSIAGRSSPQVKSGAESSVADCAMRINSVRLCSLRVTMPSTFRFPVHPERLQSKTPTTRIGTRSISPRDKPKLVFFQIDLMERDQIPVNVSIFRLKDGKLEEYYEGEDPVALPHEVQALPGNKFTPRMLNDKGTYYVAVRANHPEYKLRTRVYDPPPYTDPAQAVRTALDYILAAGDSWHANTPRRGGILDRVSSVHQETSLCVACHVTHFPAASADVRHAQRLPVVQRQQVQFLTERFYNNPRPFYGFESRARSGRG